MAGLVYTPLEAIVARVWALVSVVIGGSGGGGGGVVPMNRLGLLVSCRNESPTTLGLRSNRQSSGLCPSFYRAYKVPDGQFFTGFSVCDVDGSDELERLCFFRGFLSGHKPEELLPHPSTGSGSPRNYCRHPIPSLKMRIIHRTFTNFGRSLGHHSA